MSRTTSLVRLIAATVIATALLLATASFAFAAVGEPTLGLAALQAKLDASPTGTLTGYLKTVVRGATIETIPVEVKGLTGDTPDSSLILFEATGDKIAAYGGIVSGMSGSPIYVEDGGVDKVIGALSYGDAFTRGGSGLATPIEPMLRLETDYAPRVELLSSPVVMSGRLVDRVVISSDPQALRKVAAAGAFVAAPLSSVFIGGLRPTGPAYVDLAKRLKGHGISVVELGAGLSAGASDFTTDLAPGAAIGALATRGDVWVGGLGTVTWANGDTVLAFGHPAFFTGASSLYMSNAWVTGVWPSLASPYKIGYPTAIRGTITQDRNTGIMGALGAAPAETPLTAHATDTDNGHEASSTTWVSSELLDSAAMGGLQGAAASVAAGKLFDAEYTPGSAATTTTVRVAVGADIHTVTLVDLLDSKVDIPSAIGQDADYAVDSLLAVLDNGVERPAILSVDVQASITTHRASGGIVGVALREPLHEGDNRVTVSVLAYGLAATQTVETTLTVPEGAPLAGTIEAVGAMDESAGSADGPTDGSGGGSSAPAARDTVVDVVTRLNAEAPGNSFTVTLVPPDSTDAAVDEAVPVSVTQTAPWVLSGTASAAITQLGADVSPRTVSYGGYAMVSGEVDGPTKPVLVKIYGTVAGSTTERLLAQETAFRMEGTLVYAAELNGLRSNTSLRIVVDGGSDYTPAEATAYVQVRAKIGLTSSARKVRFGRHVKLTARVTPRTAHGRVAFQYYDGAKHRWRTIGTRYLHTVGSYAVATIDWMPRWGDRKVRVVYNGDRYNAGATSAKITTSAR
jgi:hypothetical protein